ncbi:hypothetical protein [Microseira sp. BLCC-F43]|uniref:hypothetical protein n=1 Tax=Microseira sp. BLCC-F43 TaxID=3153602 RepID=UPI0035B7A49A
MAALYFNPKRYADRTQSRSHSDWATAIAFGAAPTVARYAHPTLRECLRHAQGTPLHCRLWEYNGDNELGTIYEYIFNSGTRTIYCRAS